MLPYRLVILNNIQYKIHMTEDMYVTHISSISYNLDIKEVKDVNLYKLILAKFNNDQW